MCIISNRKTKHRQQDCAPSHLANHSSFFRLDTQLTTTQVKRSIETKGTLLAPPQFLVSVLFDEAQTTVTRCNRKRTCIHFEFRATNARNSLVDTFHARRIRAIKSHVLQSALNFNYARYIASITIRLFSRNSAIFRPSWPVQCLQRLAYFNVGQGFSW